MHDSRAIGHVEGSEQGVRVTHGDATNVLVLIVATASGADSAEVTELVVLIDEIVKDSHLRIRRVARRFIYENRGAGEGAEACRIETTVGNHIVALRLGPGLLK